MKNCFIRLLVPRMALGAGAVACTFLAALRLGAVVPPAPQLLPKDTLLMVTVPDWTGSAGAAGSSSMGKLWADGSLVPFRQHFETQFREKILGKMEKDLGIKTADYLTLLQGQLTVAVVADGWDGSPKTEPHFVLILDTKEKSGELKTRLEEVRKKLSESGKNPKTEKIREIEFTTVTIEAKPEAKSASKNKADEDEEEEETTPAKPKKQTYVFGQVESALLISDSPVPLEKLVARINGGSVPSVGDEALFAASAPKFRGAQAYGWLNGSAMMNALVKSLSENEMFEQVGTDASGAFKALGLSGLRTAAFAAKLESDGARVELNLNIPENDRRGLFKMMSFPPKDTAPLPFVPVDVTQFMRLRVDWRKFIGTLEDALKELSPQMGGMFNMMVGAAGKDKDPNFDLRKSLFGNLGDDLLMYSRPAAGTSAEELQNAPSLTLLSSPGADDLVSGLKALTGMAPGGGAGGKEREVSGKKIQSLPLPLPGKADSKMEYVGSGGYVAFSRQPAMVEEYIRSADGAGKSLKENTELTVAAEQVGGLGTGMFVFENQRETMRGTWEMLRNGGASKSMLGKGEWAALVDFTKLPSYDLVKKYYGIRVSSGQVDSQGFSFRSYGPNPK